MKLFFRLIANFIARIHSFYRIKAPPEINLSNPPSQYNQLPLTPPKDTELTEKEPQQFNTVELTRPQENPKEIISEIIEFPSLNSYNLVLGKDIDIVKDERMPPSGEAEIWTITGEILNNNSQKYLAKIYHQTTSEQIQKLPERVKKLEVMVAHQSIAVKFSPNYVSLAWPQYLLENSSGEVIGFLTALRARQRADGRGQKGRKKFLEKPLCLAQSGFKSPTKIADLVVFNWIGSESLSKLPSAFCLLPSAFFNQGHDHPELRPTATDWADALQAALDNLVQCESLSSHWYSKTYGRCHWCERKKELGKDIFSDDTEQYKRLNMLLKAGKWKEADLETKYLMLKISSRLDKGWLDESAIADFPVQYLKMINQLWLEHSSGRFGFSVQKRIYLEIGNQPGGYNRETYNRFGEVVGWQENKIWKNYLDLEFSLSAPDGHLPWCCAGFDVCLVSYLSCLC